LTIIKIGGRVYEIHKNDVDKVHPPEKVHLHDLESGNKVGGETGNIYDRKGKEKIGHIGKKNLGKLNKILKGLGFLSTILTTLKIYTTATEKDPEKQFENLLESLQDLPADKREKILEEIIKNNPDKFKEIDPKINEGGNNNSSPRTSGSNNTQQPKDKKE
jgi:hypothetical protein